MMAVGVYLHALVMLSPSPSPTPIQCVGTAQLRTLWCKAQPKGAVCVPTSATEQARAAASRAITRAPAAMGRPTAIVSPVTWFRRSVPTGTFLMDSVCVPQAFMTIQILGHAKPAITAVFPATVPPT